MPRYLRSKAVMSKIEAVYATDPVPTGVANAVLCKDDVRFTPMESDRVPREVIQAYMGHQEDLPVGTRARLEMDLEMAGAGGAVDLPPAMGPLLRQCGFAETINVANSVSYKPVSTGFESGSTYFNNDGVLNKVLGGRGSLSGKITPGGIAYLMVKLLGLYGGESDAALTAQTVTGWKKPKPVNKVNTPTVTLHGYACKLYDFSFDMANDLVYRNLPGVEDVQVTDRKPTGSIEIEATMIADKDWPTIIQNATLGALQIVHGVGVGNVVQIDMPAVELGDYTRNNRNGILTYQFPLRICPTAAGNDEVTLTFK